MATEQEEVVVPRIALLRAPQTPANRRRLAVMKEDSMPKTQIPIDDADLAAAVKAATETPALATAFKALAGKPRDGFAALAKVKTEQGRAAVLGAIQILDSVKSEIPQEVMSELMRQAEIVEEPKEDEMPEKPKEPAAAAKQAGGIPLEPIVKADGSFDLSLLPEDRRPLAEALWTQTIALRKQATDAREALAKESAAREAIAKEMRRRDLVAVVKSEMPHAPGASADELAAALLALEDGGVAKEHRERIVGVIKAASAAVKEFLPARGVDRPGDAGGAPMEAIRKQAATLRTANPKLTEAQAIDRVLATPEGRRAAREHKEQRGRAA